MRNIYSNILKFNKANVIKAVSYLNQNNVVGLPTETVYGLAGNAYSLSSIKKIFRLKKRPTNNPLIIHYYSLKDAHKDVYFNSDFLKLYKRFCPGPITFILKKKPNSKIQPMATAKLATVAIRFPKNSKIRSILKNIYFPLAMPSANKSSGISPVNAKDVFEEFNNKIKIIVDGGNSSIGIESTVVDLTKKVCILRPGFIDSKTISKFLKKKISYTNNSKLIKAPGSLKIHYSPGIPIILNQKSCPKNVAFITMGKKFPELKNYFNLSKTSNLNEAAKNLYKIFRKIKKKNYKKIFIVKIPNKNIGVAINDRLKRAANLK